MIEGGLMTRDEEALEELIRASAGPVAVCLGESFHPGTSIMTDRVMAAGEEAGEMDVIPISIRHYSAWATRYDAYGTPTLLLFRHGKLCGRAGGVLSEEQIRQFLATCQ